ncbi:NIPSNAP family protein [Hydrogenophaga soli]
MITVHVTYDIDPFKVSEFETYARMWIPLVEKWGGVHHGYFLPHEGANHVAYCLFSFDSLAAYEQYRLNIQSDDACRAAFEYAEQTRCVRSVSRNFMRPVFSMATGRE